MNKKEIKDSLYKAIDKLVLEEATADDHIVELAKQQIDKFCASAEGKKFIENEIRGAIKALIQDDQDWINDILYGSGIHKKLAQVMKKVKVSL